LGRELEGAAAGASRMQASQPGKGAADGASPKHIANLDPGCKSD